MVTTTEMNDKRFREGPKLLAYEPSYRTPIRCWVPRARDLDLATVGATTTCRTSYTGLRNYQPKALCSRPADKIIPELFLPKRGILG